MKEPGLLVHGGAEGEVTQQELDLLVILELTEGCSCDSQLASARGTASGVREGLHLRRLQAGTLRVPVPPTAGASDGQNAAVQAVASRTAIKG